MDNEAYAAADALSKPFQHMFFCGEHTTPDGPRAMNSALQSGVKAAEQILAVRNE